MGDSYFAIDTSGGKVYNILKQFGRIPKDNEELVITRPRLQLYNGVVPIETVPSYELVEKK